MHLVRHYGRARGCRHRRLVGQSAVFSRHLQDEPILALINIALLRIASILRIVFSICRFVVFLLNLFADWVQPVFAIVNQIRRMVHSSLVIAAKSFLVQVIEHFARIGACLNEQVAVLAHIVILLVVFKDVEWIEACLVLRHANQHVFLLLLRLLGRVEEGVENAFECLNFVDWARLFLNLLFHSNFSIECISPHSSNLQSRIAVSTLACSASTGVKVGERSVYWTARH